MKAKMRSGSPLFVLMLLIVSLTCEPPLLYGALSSSVSLFVAQETDPADVIRPGELLRYTITYGNEPSASQTATEVTVTGVYDPNVAFVSADPAPDAGTDNVWTLGDLAPGETGTIEMTVRVGSPLPDGTVLRNVVVIQSAEGSVSSTETTGVQSGVSLSVTQTDSTDPVKPGETLTYTIVYGNDEAADETATRVTVTGVYDPNVTFVSADPAPDAGTDNF